jgi:hypothetical protein
MAAETPAHIRHHRPAGLSTDEGFWLMDIARSTFYDTPAGAMDDTAPVQAMRAVKNEFEAYGGRRMQAALRQQAGS